MRLPSERIAEESQGFKSFGQRLDVIGGNICGGDWARSMMGHDARAGFAAHVWQAASSLACAKQIQFLGKSKSHNIWHYGRTLVLVQYKFFGFYSWY